MYYKCIENLVPIQDMLVYKYIYFDEIHLYHNHGKRNMKGNSKIKVLIVDDSLIVVERLSAIISEMTSVGSVLISNSFNQAVELIPTELPDVILLDIQLPGKNGIELLEFVKSKYSYIKIIIVTNRASAYYKELCEQMGADSFVDKSTEFEKIPAIIESLCCVDCP